MQYGKRNKTPHFRGVFVLETKWDNNPLAFRLDK